MSRRRSLPRVASDCVRAIVVGGLLAPPLVVMAPAPAGAVVTATGVVAWGINLTGQLGDGTTTRHYTPAAVSGLSDANQLAAGLQHSVARRAGGTLVAWGDNSSGQLGDTTTTQRNAPVPVSGVSGVTTVAAPPGGSYTLALLATGAVMAWGENASGQLGLPADSAAHPTPAVIGALASGVSAIAAGDNHALAVMADGSVRAWGDNTSGQLGDGTTTPHSTPAPVSGLGAGSGVVAVAAGAGFSLALKADGSVMSWGSNDQGVLGTGTYGTNQLSAGPVRNDGNTGPLTGVKTLVAADRHVLAQMSDGSVEVWGSDQEGELGRGQASASSPLPLVVAGVVGVTTVAAGYDFDMVLAGSEMRVWGNNGQGQLGLGFNDSSGCFCQPSPRLVTVAARGPQPSMAGGTFHAMVLALHTAPGVRAFPGISVFRPSSDGWYFFSPAASATYGTSGDIAVPGDYDGDGNIDIAVFRPSSGVWYIHPSGGGPDVITAWGTNGDIPVPGDYDGDGKTDIAVFRPSTGTWYIKNSDGSTTSTFWGASGDIPVPGDYNGDGKTDIAVFRPSTGTWYIKNSDGTITSTKWGTTGDIPVPGDYDGDGKTDIAVFRPTTSTWYIHPSGGGPDITTAWGANGDMPLPIPWAIRQFFF
ncbi:MAG: FG-GAP-like repeat-containing protein [Actinomycetota bacterium]|nr:FG-GAP-like repeat-containing protein [Actinomycetota bacterium]